MKVTIFGIGKVGASLAYVLSTKNIIRELVLVGRNHNVVQGEALDLRHGQLFTKTPAKITAGTLADSKNSDIVALCASVPTPKTMTSRLELAQQNIALMSEVLPEIARLSPHCKIVMVSNPVDILVQVALEITQFSHNQIMGTGTLVDSARFRQLLSDELNIHTEDIHAYILGEHGESQFLAMSCAEAGGEPIEPTPERFALAKKAASAGFDVFKLRGYTNYTVALAAAYIIEAIVLDTKRTMPISVKVDGFLGVDDVCLSLPVVVGRNGVERVLHPKLNEAEQQSFQDSAQVVRGVIEACRSSSK